MIVFDEVLVLFFLTKKTSKILKIDQYEIGGTR